MSNLNLDAANVNITVDLNHIIDDHVRFRDFINWLGMKHGIHVNNSMNGQWRIMYGPERLGPFYSWQETLDAIFDMLVKGAADNE
jgi:hypothetical protein